MKNGKESVFEKKKDGKEKMEKMESKHKVKESKHKKHTGFFFNKRIQKNTLVFSTRVKNAVGMRVFPASGAYLPLKLYAKTKQTRFRPRNSKK